MLVYYAIPETVSDYIYIHVYIYGIAACSTAWNTSTGLGFPLWNRRAEESGWVHTAAPCVDFLFLHAFGFPRWAV